MIIRTHRFASLLVAALFVAISLAPLAGAAHMTLYYVRDADGNPVDPGIGVVQEDDGEVVHQPNGALDGVRNRVIRNQTDGIGSGGQIMDTDYYDDFRTSSVGIYNTFLDAVMEPVEGDRNVMRPGRGGFMTWFGWWNDLNNDGRINDFHDVGSSACPITVADCVSKDEFKWKGSANGVSTTMAFYMVPTNVNAGSGGGPVTDRVGTNCFNTCFSAWMNGTISSPDGLFDDRTELSEEQQMWILGTGSSNTWTDESYLTSVTTVTIADAKRSNAAEVQYDFSDPLAYIDVDRYEAISSDAEALWGALAPVIKATATSVRPADLLAPVAEEVNKITRDGVPGVINTISTAISDATREFEGITPGIIAQVSDAQGQANRKVTPLFLKEPNTFEDIYPGAVFDGTADARGLGNDYSLHAADYHLFVDAQTRTVVPGGPNVVGPPGTTGVGQYGTLATTTIEPGDENRGQAPGFLYVGVNVALWFDENGDNWLGRACDPTKESDWDTAAGECKAPHGATSNTPDPNNYAHFKETYANCGDTTLSGAGASGTGRPGFSITPIGKTWAQMTGGLGVVKVRWFDRPMYNVWHQNEMGRFLGTETIELELDACTGTATFVRGVDALLIPTGTLDGTIRTEISATMVRPFVDATRGVEVFPETVKDVDYLFASL